MDVTGFLKQTSDRVARTRDYRELVREYYDSVTPFYHRGWGECFHFAPFYGREPVAQALEAQQRLLVHAAKIERGQSVLDVGCGIGGPGRAIARLTGAQVTGVTISPEQVKTAGRLIRKHRLEEQCAVVLGDAMQLDFSDERFDAVVAIESACHMPDKAAFYGECARVLRPGGRFAGWDWIFTPRGDASDAAAVREHAEPICTYFALPSLSTLPEIGEHLRSAGLELETLEDLATLGSSRRWFAPLADQLRSPISRLAARLSRTLSMMQRSGELLVRAAEAGAFSPLGFFVARKPAGGS